MISTGTIKWLSMRNLDTQRHSNLLVKNVYTTRLVTANATIYLYLVNVVKF